MPSRRPRFLLGPPPTGRSTQRRPVWRTTSSRMPRSCLETCSQIWPRRTSGTAGSAQRVLVGLAALALLLSGLWAMLAPESFYASVALYPPYNRHFIHDIGAFMLGLGAALGFALALGDALLVALAGNAVGALAHFVSHAVDRELGGQPSDPLTFGVFALLLVGVTVWRARVVGVRRP